MDWDTNKFYVFGDVVVHEENFPFATSYKDKPLFPLTHLPQSTLQKIQW